MVRSGWPRKIEKVKGGKKMKFTGGSIMLLAMCVAVSFLLAMPGASFAADQDRDQVQLRLRDQICDDTGLSKGELNKYEPLITEALELNGGDAEPIRNMFRKSVGEGCVDECLMERLRTRNRAMKQEQKLDAEQTKTQERTRERTRDQTGEQSGEMNQEQNQEQNQKQNQEQTGEQGQNQSGSGSGGGKGN